MRHTSFEPHFGFWDTVCINNQDRTGQNQTTSSPSPAQTVVLDAKENREKKMAARTPGISRGHLVPAVHLRSRPTDQAKERPLAVQVTTVLSLPLSLSLSI